MPEPLVIPASRIEDPRTAPAMRWGIVGPGRIAAQFARSLHGHSEQRVTAVASRDSDRANRFAREHGVERAFDSTEALAASPDVDVVYVATPHTQHRDCALLAISAGKHVLVEKPLAPTAAEASEIADAAAAAGVFAMEAMWPRFTPATDSIRQLLERGDLGEIRFVRADLGEHFAPDARDRLFDPGLAGGSLLDLGVYLAAFTSFVCGGAPESVSASGHRAFTGVSADAAVTEHRASGTAQWYTTLESRTPTEAFIRGSRATLRLPAPFYAPGSLVLASVNGTDEATASFDVGSQDAGLCYEAAEAARCIADGRLESPLHPLGESVGVLRTLDRVEALLP